MPSYRLRLEVGAMKAGAMPQNVLPAAERATATTCFVEAKDIDISGGAAWVQLRVTVDESGPLEEDDAARAALAALRDGVEPLAETGRAYILRRWPKGVWRPVDVERADPRTGEIPLS